MTVRTISRLNRLRVGSCLAGLLSLGVFAAEPPLDDSNQPYDQFSMEVVTPHTPWANPAVLPPLNALVIAPCWQFRDTVELAQRLSLNVTPLMVAHNTAYYGVGESMKDIDGDLDSLAELRLSEARQYQVIIIGKVVWSAFPAAIREKILARVAQGTGLVYVSPAGEDDGLKVAFAKRDTAAESAVLDGVPVAAMPLKLPAIPYPAVPAIGPFELRLGALGQGRVAVVDYKDLTATTAKSVPGHWATPFQLTDGPWYDYYFAIVARAAQWAGRRELPVRVIPKLVQGLELPRAEAVANGGSFTVQTATEFQGAANAVWRLRNERDVTVLEKNEATKLAGLQDLSIPLPALAAGLYVLDLRVLVEGRAAGWGSWAFRVTAPGAIRTVQTERETFRSGDTIRGRVELAAPLVPGQTLGVHVRDRLGRRVAQAPVKLNGTAGEFSLSLPAPLGCIFDAVVTLADKGGPLEEKSTTFFLPNPRRDNFMWFQWGGPSADPLAAAATRQMQAVAGLTGYYDGVLYNSSWEAVRPVALAGARQGLQALPYCTTYIIPPDKYEKTADGLALMKDTPWSNSDINDPKYLEQTRTHLQKLVKAYAGCDAVGYSLNEEGGVPPGESCFCSFCLKGFSEYAQKKYGSLEVANKSWGTAYTNWMAVRGGTLPDALKAGRCERWLDQRLFMIESYNRWQLAAIDGAKSADLAAQVGPHVVVAVDRSFDIPGMVGNWGTFGHDVDYMDAVRRSFMKPNELAESESGNLPMEEDFHRYWPWHTFLQGMTQIFWYPEFHSEGLGGIAALFPDLRPFACFRQTGEEVREIQQSVGPLVLQGEMLVAPVAIHWSTLSYFIDLYQHPETRWLDSLRDAFHALADAGIVYRYVGTPQIEAGGLKNLKVLVLPYTQALTTREAAAIREFVQNGGLLVADFAPGVFDANGTRLPVGQLADLFGDGKVLDVKTIGKGHAVMLGGTLKGYTGRRGAGDAGDRRGLTRMISQFAGVVPWCRVEDMKGLDRGDTEATVFRNGGTFLLGLLRDPGIRSEIAGAGGQWTVQRAGAVGDSAAALETMVRLPAKYHIYDVRRHDYLGFADQFQTGLVKARAKIFALLPVKPAGLELTLSSAKPKAGEPLTITVAVKPGEAAACGFGVRFTVTGPDGKEKEEYSCTLVMRNGRVETVIAPAFDEVSGDYIVTVEEVISGLRAKKTYTIKR